jgi:hypothetical protein
MKNRPTMPITASGTNFRTVVTTWMRPLSRTPRMLANVSSQIRPMPTSAPSSLWSPTCGQNTVR